MNQLHADPHPVVVRCTEPSITASTFNSRAISGRGVRVPLNRITDVRDTTLRALIGARFPMSASVIPSAK